MVAVGIATVVIFSQLIDAQRQITEKWEALENGAAHKQRLLARLGGDIGYGGFIHHFKLYILRADEDHHRVAKENLADAREVLIDYSGLQNNEKERRALSDITTTIGDYARSIALAEEMIGKSYSPIAVDEAVIVDDTAAIRALEDLRRELSESYRHNAALLHDSTLNASHRLMQAAFVIGGMILLLIAIYVWFMQSIVRAPLTVLGKAMTSLSKGDTERDIPFTGQHNEIGEMARTVESFRKTVIKLGETEADLAARLRESKFQKKTLDEHAIVSIADVKGDIIYANDKFCDISGYSREELIGNNHRMLKSDEHSREFYADLWRTIANGGTWHGEIKNLGKSGQPYWVKATIVPFLDKDGKPFRYVGLRTDITEQKEHGRLLSESHAEMEEAKAAAEKANQAKSKFLSAMSHELRTPLNAILGFAQVLEWNKNTPLSERQKDQVHQIKKGGEHLLKLIDEILDLAKIESGYLSLSLEPVAIRPLLDECVAIAASLATNRNIIIIIDETEDNLPDLWTDHLRIKQAVLNLLSNAVKYNKEGGKIWLTSEIRDNGHYRLSIRDTGDGIAEERQADLFQPFNRLGAEATEVEGTGIGLTLTKKIIEEMNGSIGFSSKQGQGSVFWIEVPVARNDDFGAAGKLDRQTIDHDAFADGERTVLYVEDNPANLSLMEDIVASIPNLSLISTHTAELGLILAEDRRPDIIILDINLPGMDGLEAVRQLKGKDSTRDIPVIALSADAMPKMIERGLEAGFKEYLTKPVNVAELVNALSNALGDTE